MKQIIKGTSLFLSLFSSGATLICCAIPALLVLLGAGASLAGFIAVFPQITWLSQHKLALFIVAGSLLAISGYIEFTSKQRHCPLDRDLGHACATTKHWSYYIWVVGFICYSIGGFFAFLLPLFI